MDDLDSGSHHNKSFQNVYDLNENSSINSKEKRHLRHNELQIIHHQRFEIEGNIFLQSGDIFLIFFTYQ